MSFDLVLFGGTGDLAWRKLLPALFQAFRHGTLPEGGRIISVARDDLTDDQYRSRIQMRFDDVELAKRPTPQEFSRFAALLQGFDGCHKGQSHQFVVGIQGRQQLSDDHAPNDFGTDGLESCDWWHHGHGAGDRADMGKG